MKVIGHFAVLIGVSLAAGAALAVLPPEAYQQARDSAQAHVVLAVTEIVVPERTPGECTVTGDVVVIGRDLTSGLSIGSRLSLAISCTREGDEIPAGGTLWQSASALQAATHLEAYVNPVEGGGWEVARWQSSIVEPPAADEVEAPSSQPAEAGPE